MVELPLFIPHPKQVPAGFGVAAAGARAIAVGSFAVGHDGVAVDGQAQGRADDGHNPGHGLELLGGGRRGAEAGQGGVPAGVQGTAKGDAHAAGVALVGVGLALGQGVAGAIDLSVLVHVQVIVIKVLVISASGPVQVQVMNLSLGLLGQKEQFLGGDAGGICYLHGCFLSVAILICGNRCALWGRGGAAKQV